MVLMQGTNRVLDKANIETSSSSTVRTVNIYGITSYSNMVNSIITVKSAASGVDGAVTLNINNLGAKSIKVYKEGIKENPSEYWTSTGQAYQLLFDGVDFILLNGSQESSESNDFYIDYSVLELTNSSTAAQIKTALEVLSTTSEDFMIALKNRNNIKVLLNDTARAMYDVQVSEVTTLEDTILVITDTNKSKAIKFYRQNESSTEYRAVEVTPYEGVHNSVFNTLKGRVDVIEPKVTALETKTEVLDIKTAPTNTEAQTAGYTEISQLPIGNYYVPYSSTSNYSWLNLPGTSKYGRVEVIPFNGVSDHKILKFYAEDVDIGFYIRVTTEELGFWKKVSLTNP